MSPDDPDRDLDPDPDPDRDLDPDRGRDRDSDADQALEPGCWDRLESSPINDHIPSMKPLRVSEDVVPVGQFKAQAKRWLARASETGQPLVITQNGRPAGVLLSPAEFDRLVERERFLRAVDEGLADAEAGRMIPTDDLRRRLGVGRRKAR